MTPHSAAFSDPRFLSYLCQLGILPLAAYVRPRFPIAIAIPGLLFSGMVTGAFSWPASAAALSLFVALAACRAKNKAPRAIGFLMVTLFTLGLFGHKLPGFNNLGVYYGLSLKPQSAPFTFYLNFDKPLFAMLYLALFGHKLFAQASWQRILKAATWQWLPLTALVVGAGYLSGFIVWDPGVPPYSLLWAVNNLLIVCVAEEAFFRGLLQRGLRNHGLRRGWPEWLPTLLAALAFGLAHFAGGPVYVALSSVAGWFYGKSYQSSNSLESPILCHFFLNTFHFFLFSYPYVG